MTMIHVVYITCYRCLHQLGCRHCHMDTLWFRYVGIDAVVVLASLICHDIHMSLMVSKNVYIVIAWHGMGYGGAVNDNKREEKEKKRKKMCGGTVCLASRSVM